MQRFPFNREYIERLASGDPEIERHFATYFGELLLIKLRARLRCTQWALDLRQETFVRVLRALQRSDVITKPESLGSFVNSVCENVLLEFFRSGKGTMQMEEDAPEPADGSCSVESELITDERLRLMKEILAELPDSDRALIRGVFLDERDKDQICRELNIDRNYLRVRIHRALARFRSCLQTREQLSRAAKVAG